MKISGLVITGILLGCAGVTLACYAANRSDFNIEKYTKSNISFTTDTFDAKEVKKINLKSDFDCIEIVKVDRDDILVKSKTIDELKYAITLEDETLSISQTYSDWKTSFFTTHWINAYAFSKSPTVIEVPSYISFEYDIKLCAGTLKANDLSSDEFKVSLDAGTAKLSDISAKNLTVKVDAGTCKFDNTKSENTSIEISAGTLEYRGVIQNKGNINIDAGTIDLKFQNSVDDYMINGHGSGDSIITVDKYAGSFNYSFNN